MTTNVASPRIDIDKTIQSGQMFLWERHDKFWYGIHGESVIKVRVQDRLDNNDYKLDRFNEPLVSELFRIDDDFNDIASSLSSDPFMQELLSKYQGLRIMRQDPCQCLLSFICATNTNIQMIRLMLKRLCNRFGRQVTVDGHSFFTFPSADKLAGCSDKDLHLCGLGYRARAMKAVAQRIVSGELDIQSVRTSKYSEAKEKLLDIYGVGNKIADCVLLFAFDKLESFPIDIWIARALDSYYRLNGTGRINDKLTEKQYRMLSELARSKFGKYAGYAQQYLYYHVRESAGKKW